MSKPKRDNEQYRRQFYIEKLKLELAEKLCVEMNSQGVIEKELCRRAEINEKVLKDFLSDGIADLRIIALMFYALKKAPHIILESTKEGILGDIGLREKE